MGDVTAVGNVGPAAVGPGDAGPGDAGPADVSAGDGKVAGCELCEAARFTPWHHEDDTCWVADCEACDVPIVVWNRHGAEPPADQLAHMLATIEKVADGLYGPGGWYLDRTMRQIPDHFHAHGRANDWLARRRRF